MRLHARRHRPRAQGARAAHRRHEEWSIPAPAGPNVAASASRTGRSVRLLARPTARPSPDRPAPRPQVQDVARARSATSSCTAPTACGPTSSPSSSTTARRASPTSSRRGPGRQHAAPDRAAAPAGLPTPRYLRTPLVCSADGEKLSKQTGAAPVDLSHPLAALRDAGKVLDIAGEARRARLEGAVAAWRWARGRRRWHDAGLRFNTESIP